MRFRADSKWSKVFVNYAVSLAIDLAAGLTKCMLSDLMINCPYLQFEIMVSHYINLFAGLNVLYMGS